MLKSYLLSYRCKDRQQQQQQQPQQEEKKTENSLQVKKLFVIL